MRQYQRQEAFTEDHTLEEVNRDRGDSNASIQGSSSSSTSRSSSSESIHSVSFGTVSLRVYERILDARADVDLGLTIGWKYSQQSPIDLEMVANKDGAGYREAEVTSEGERAELLLASGYSRRQLRSAMKRRRRRMERGDDEMDTTIIPEAIRDMPSRVFRRISRGIRGE